MPYFDYKRVILLRPFYLPACSWRPEIDLPVGATGSEVQSGEIIFDDVYPHKVIVLPGTVGYFDDPDIDNCPVERAHRILMIDMQMRGLLPSGREENNQREAGAE